MAIDTSVVRHVTPKEAVEKAGTDQRCNGVCAVRPKHLHPQRVMVCTDTNPSAWRGVLEGVAAQIVKGLRQQLRITLHDKILVHFTGNSHIRQF